MHAQANFLNVQAIQILHQKIAFKFNEGRSVLERNGHEAPSWPARHRVAIREDSLPVLGAFALRDYTRIANFSCAHLCAAA